jgi:hypothetical protein
MQAWLYGGHRRPTPSGHFPARECTPWPIVAGFHFGNPRAMRLRRTLHRSRGDHPVLAWAVRYALAAVVVGADILLIGPSPGVGWALVVFGGSLATLASGLFTRRGAEADSGTAGSALGASRRDRPDRRIPRARGQRRASAAGRRSRGPRSIARWRHAFPASSRFGVRRPVPARSARAARAPAGGAARRPATTSGRGTRSSGSRRRRRRRTSSTSSQSAECRADEGHPPRRSRRHIVDGDCRSGRRAPKPLTAHEPTRSAAAPALTVRVDRTLASMQSSSSW